MYIRLMVCYIEIKKNKPLLYATYSMNKSFRYNIHTKVKSGQMEDKCHKTGDFLWGGSTEWVGA